jgi:hypothetical protein
MRGIHKLGRLVPSGRQIGTLNHADDGNHKGSRPEGPSEKVSMSNIAKRQGRMIRKGKEVRYGSVHIDLIGPTELLHNREAKGAAIDFLRTEILASKDWLKDCAKISPSLKRFRLVSTRT